MLYLFLRDARDSFHRLLFLLDGVLYIFDLLQCLSQVVFQLVVVLLRFGEVVLEFLHLISKLGYFRLLPSHHVLVLSNFESKGVVLFMQLGMHGLESHVFRLQVDVGLSNCLIQTRRFFCNNNAMFKKYPKNYETRNIPPSSSPLRAMVIFSLRCMRRSKAWMTLATARFDT